MVELMFGSFEQSGVIHIGENGLVQYNLCISARNVYNLDQIVLDLVDEVF